jgi:DNA-binding LacI/PurR family transcriptional regulator
MAGMERVPLQSISLRQNAVTIRDVAREAHVAVGTASRVLTGSPRVRQETRERVLAVAERLGYRPNPTARALAKGKTNTLGVLVPFFFTRQNHVEIVRGIQAGIAEYDYSLVIHSVERPEQARAQFATLIRSGRVDGLVVVSLDGNVIDHDTVHASFPILYVDSVHEGLPALVPNHEHGAYLATHHLIQVHAHESIAFVDRPQDPVSQAHSAARRLGFLAAFREHRLEPNPHAMVIEDYTAEGGYAAARRLLDLPSPPTAFVCASDLQAIGVMRAARELSLRVGHDLGIVGYNDVLIAEYLGLSTVHVPSFQIGRDAVGTLLVLMDGQQQETSVRYIEPRLVTRTSCGCGE